MTTKQPQPARPKKTPATPDPEVVVANLLVAFHGGGAAPTAEQRAAVRDARAYLRAVNARAAAPTPGGA